MSSSRLSKLLSLVVLSLFASGAGAAMMSVELAGLVNRVGGDVPPGFPIEEGDDMTLSLDLDSGAPDLDPSGHGLYAIDFLRLVLGDFVYEATTGAGLEVLPAGSGNYRLNLVFNAGARPELGPLVQTPTAAGLMFSPTNNEFLRIFLPGFPFMNDAIPFDALEASAGTIASGNFNTWFKNGDERADVRFRLQSLAANTVIPEPASLALLGPIGVAFAPRRRGVAH